MKTIAFDNITIDRIVELDQWKFTADHLFPSITADIINEGRDWLDERFIDQHNQLILGVHSYIIRINSRIILVDTCNGNHKNRPALLSHHQLNTPYIENLRHAGYQPEDIDTVLCTHLHPDHCGWNTRLTNGRWVPTFPNAKYLMSKIEFERLQNIHATLQENPVMKDFGRTFEDSVLPIMHTKQAVLIDAGYLVEHEIDNGVWLETARGHTPDHMFVHIKRNHNHAVMTGDVIHHPIQFSALDMPNASDYAPLMAASTRRQLIESYVDTDTFILTGHFPSLTAGRIITHGSKFRFQWVK